MMTLIDKIAALEARLLATPEEVAPRIEMPLTHHFAPGVYGREVFVPAGTFVIGHKHRTEHLNVVLSGRAAVLIDGKVEEIRAPAVFVSQPGVRKVVLSLEDLRWITIHPSAETDLEKLEELLITKSPGYLHHEELKKLSAHLEAEP